jgi:hypothetical protein
MHRYHDVEWVGIQQGRDFKAELDVAHLFRVPTVRRAVALASALLRACVVLVRGVSTVSLRR